MSRAFFLIFELMYGGIVSLERLERQFQAAFMLDRLLQMALVPVRTASAQEAVKDALLWLCCGAGQIMVQHHLIR